jgi:hydroxymethylbilane synthase
MTNNTTANTKLRIGTRASPLALAQAHQVRDALIRAHAHLSEDTVEIVTLSTKGDRIQNQALSELGGKGLFTEEIEDGLLSADLDLAVHSMKDMPTQLPDGLGIVCMLEREDVRDAFLSDKAASLADLPAGAVVGTASLRRQAQILHHWPHLKVVTFRGNVQSRLRKLQAGDVDATMLALAGLNRLGLSGVAADIVATGTMLPAIAQGAIGIETRFGDQATRDLLVPLNHAQTEQRVIAERACLAVLDGSCRTPIAGLATIAGGQLTLQAQILLPDGSEIHETTSSGAVADAEQIGRDAGAKLLQMAGPDFLAKI